MASPMILDYHPDRIHPKSKGWKYLGFWATSQDPSKCEYLIKRGMKLPWPGEYVEPRWDPLVRAAVATYLDEGEEVYYYDGITDCRLCGEFVGCRDLGDGVYVWPEGLGHYVREHGVGVPEEFREHVQERTRRLEDRLMGQIRVAEGLHERLSTWKNFLQEHGDPGERLSYKEELELAQAGLDLERLRSLLPV